MNRFAEWSERAATNPTIWTQPDRPAATMSIMLAQRLTRYPIEIETGEAEAEIDLHHATVRHPEPFKDGHLTDACRRFIYDAACAAVDHDRHLRWIVWADRSLTSANPVNGYRKAPRLG